jgi:hypothetical protein
MHPIQPFPRNPLRFEGLPDLGNPRLAAEHTQVASWTVINLLQDGMVVPMPTRHQYHIIILAEVERLPHVRKWHGQGRIGFWKAFLADKGRIVIDDAHPEPDQGRSAYQRRNNRHLIPNDGQRYHHGEAIATGFVESTVHDVVSKRFCKKQQMQWSKPGAHVLLPTRVKTLNGELSAIFKCWYPDMDIEGEEMPAAA